MSGLAGLSRGTRVPICPGVVLCPVGTGQKSARRAGPGQIFAGLSRGTSGTGTKNRWTVASRPLPIPDQNSEVVFRCFSSDSRPSPENFLSLLGKDHTLNLAKKIQIYTMYRLLRSEVIPQPVARSGVTKCVNRSGFRPIGRILF